MKAIAVALLGLSLGLSGFAAETLPQVYARFGDLIVTQLNTAPFPHPQRAAGYKYKEKFFSAAEHYADSTVAIFVPKGFRQTKQVDFVVHFHGWQNHVERVLERYQLIQQFAAGGRNAVLVVPQGPRDASDSFGGKLEDPEGFKRFMDEVTATLKQRCAWNGPVEYGQIVLSGHSGGYKVISSILDHGGLTDHVKEVWLFDALYGQTEKFVSWLEKAHGRLLDIYTNDGGTKEETESLIALLKQRGKGPLELKEAQARSAKLTGPGAVFLFSALAHDEVVQRHETFRLFLETSSLAPVVPSQVPGSPP